MWPSGLAVGGMEDIVACWCGVRCCFAFAIYVERVCVGCLLCVFMLALSRWLEDRRRMTSCSERSEA